MKSKKSEPPFERRVEREHAVICEIEEHLNAAVAREHFSVGATLRILACLASSTIVNGSISSGRSIIYCLGDFVGVVIDGIEFLTKTEDYVKNCEEKR